MNFSAKVQKALGLWSSLVHNAAHLVHEIIEGNKKKIFLDQGLVSQFGTLKNEKKPEFESANSGL